ncbi:MAG: hypothetical protein JWP88_1771 [Flaviaesturariibacter sp.]|nr:hypothetical protein [Flaviaesturariibacter sp.]
MIYDWRLYQLVSGRKIRAYRPEIHAYSKESSAFAKNYLLRFHKPLGYKWFTLEKPYAVLIYLWHPVKLAS